MNSERDHSTSPPAPTCKALLLCDATIVEARTGKISIIGTFFTFSPRQLPTRLSPFQVFLQVTNAAGRYDFVIEVHDLRVDKVIARAPGMGIEIPSRLTFVNIIIPVPPLPISHAGKYDIVVFANGVEIDRQQFTVNEVPDGDDTAASG